MSSLLNQENESKRVDQELKLKKIEKLEKEIADKLAKGKLTIEAEYKKLETVKEELNQYLKLSNILKQRTHKVAQFNQSLAKLQQKTIEILDKKALNIFQENERNFELECQKVIECLPVCSQINTSTENKGISSIFQEIKDLDLVGTLLEYEQEGQPEIEEHLKHQLLKSKEEEQIQSNKEDNIESNPQVDLISENNNLITVSKEELGVQEQELNTNQSDYLLEVESNSQQQQILREQSQKKHQQQGNVKQVTYLTNNKPRQYPQRFNPTAVAINSIVGLSDNRLIVGGWDGVIQIIEISSNVNDPNNQHNFINLNIESPITSIIYLQSIDCVAIASENVVYLMDRTSMQLTNQLNLESHQSNQQPGKIVELVGIKNSNTLLKNSLLVICEHSIIEYDTFNLSIIHQIQSNNNEEILRGLNIFSNEFLVSTTNGKINFYKNLKVSHSLQIHSDWVHLIQIKQSQSTNILLLSGSYDNKVVLTSINEKFEQQTISCIQFDALPQAILLIDSQSYLVAIENKVHIYNQASRINTLEIISLEKISHLSLTNDGKLVISGQADTGTVVICESELNLS